MLNSTGYFGHWIRGSELQLLLAAATAVIDPDKQDEVEKALARPFDQKLFLALSKQHRLELVAYKGVVKPFRSFFSDDIVRHFEHRVKKITLDHLQLEKSAVEISAALTGKEIPHVHLKGPVLNHMLFPGALLRYSKDLDILIPRQYFERADRTLKRLGYEPSVTLGRFRLELLLAIQKDLTYTKAKRHHPLELHWMTHNTGTLIPLTGAREDWRSFHLFRGEPLPVLPDYANAQYLCFHAAHHSWSRMRWLLDIALFVKRRNLDWKTLHQLASQRHAERTVEEAATLSREMFGLEIPNDVARPVSGRLERRLYLSSITNPPKWQTLQLLYHQGFLFSNVRERWSALALHFLRGILRQARLFGSPEPSPRGARTSSLSALPTG